MRERRLILVLVEEPPSWPADLTRALEQEGFAVLESTADAEALPLVEEALLVFLVFSTPDGAARTLLSRLCFQDAEGGGPPLIALVSEGAREVGLEALRLGAELVRLPTGTEELVARVWRCLRTRQRLESLEDQVADLQQLSITDGLTQVRNHRYFQERLREEFRRSMRYDDPLALILVDLDQFRLFNDEHGRQVGDAILQDVARVLQRNVRETDLLARYGGEEFAILLPRTPLNGALTVAERVWRELVALRTGPGGSLSITASLGLSGFPHHAVHTPEQLVLTADRALYRAKREGRNRICLHAQAPLLAAVLR